MKNQSMKIQSMKIQSMDLSMGDTKKAPIGAFIKHFCLL
jgi:hypothetical protein